MQNVQIGHRPTIMLKPLLSFPSAVPLEDMANRSLYATATKNLAKRKKHLMETSYPTSILAI